MMVTYTDYETEIYHRLMDFHQTSMGIPLGLFGRITRTSLYNFDPLKPHFYIVKLGFTGVYKSRRF